MFRISPRNLISIFVFACVILLISNSLSCFKNSIQKVISPQVSLISLIKKEFSGIIFYHRNMVLAEKLNNQLELLRCRLFDLKELSQENARLKELLSFKQKSPLRLIAARVIGRSPDSWSAGVIIDKGRNNRIVPGMIVITPRGLVGKIAESEDTTSKVLLISDPSQGVFSIVQRTRQEGLIGGTLGGNLIMRYLPEEAQISIGDTIITSELSRVYPKGLLIGKVINIGQDLSGLCRYASVRPSVDLSSIEEVLIIVP